MTGESRPETLSHLAIDREPDQEHRRRRPPPRLAASARSDRSQHADAAGRLADKAQSEILATRIRNGIDPSRLLVLELASVDGTARNQIESRLNATVVDERIQQRLMTSHLVRKAEFDETRLPSGARVRPAQADDIREFVKK